MNEYTKSLDDACMEGILSFIEENTKCKLKELLYFKSIEMKNA